MKTSTNGTGSLVDIPVWSGENIFESLEADLSQAGVKRVYLVADENTYIACGQRVEQAVLAAGMPLEIQIFPGLPELKADETSIVQALQKINGEEYLLLAVGSGTITDIVRYIAFQTRLPFLSIPTAASVDAYTSFTAAISLGQVKLSFPCKPAQAVYIDFPTLCAAPARLTASGFSDMVAKITALADWKLASLLVGDPYNDFIAQQARQALLACTRKAKAIRRGDRGGLTTLADSLMISGRCMLTVGSSRPAAGSEHSLAHFWEIYHQFHHQPDALHGEKTGVGAVLSVRIYEALRAMTYQQASQRLASCKLTDFQVEAKRLETILGPLAADLTVRRPSFLGMKPEKFEQMKANILASWDMLQHVAASVPAADEVQALLESAGSARQLDQIHVNETEAILAVQNAMYIRDRVTILEVNRLLDLVPA